MSKNYKEIIYLNSSELNSALSQLNQGLIESLVETNTNSKNTSSEAGKTTNASGGIANFLHGGVAVSDKDSEELGSLFGEEKNIVLNDFKLISLLQDSEPKSLAEAKEGDFVLTNGKFNISDFDFSETVLSNPNSSTLNPKFRNFMKDVDAWGKDVERDFKQINHFIQYANSLTQGNVILSMDQVFSFLNKDNFRINSGELQALAYTHRSLNVFGVVEAVMQKNADEVSDEISEMFDDEENDALSGMGKIIPKLTEFTFLATGVIQQNDKFIRPIALFFD